MDTRFWVNDGTFGNWIKADREARQRAADLSALSESEREELGRPSLDAVAKPGQVLQRLLEIHCLHLHLRFGTFARP